MTDHVLTPPDNSLRAYVGEYFASLTSLLAAVEEVASPERIEAIGEVLYRAYSHQKQVFVVGNGGSAATASHLACDLGKNTISPNLRRFRILSLNDNVPLLTALANDVGYERVFSEQLVNLIRPGDVLVVLSGSGSSPNIVEAARYARQRAATVVALLGFDGGETLELADEHVLVPSEDYGLVEDVHMILAHVLTGYFRKRLEFEALAP
jgi:D-sedoheptulose 7-phosphate isomerase